MKTLQTTEKKTSNDGLKGYYVCAHNLRNAKYALNLTSKYSLNSCGAMKAYKFDKLEDAILIGEFFLKSNFNGIFAHKQFMKKLYKTLS